MATSRTLRLLLALAATVALGLASRLHPVGWFLYDRILGEVLYAVAAYLALAIFLARQPPLFLVGLAFASCLAVELFKLTGIPAENQNVFWVRWFLGMCFNVVNLGYYLIGVLLIASADWASVRCGSCWSGGCADAGPGVEGGGAAPRMR